MNIMVTKNIDILSMAEYVGLSMLTKGLSVSPLKLQKILYYIQSWHMVFFGRQNTLFNECPQAWVNGPVYPTVYHVYKTMAANMCDHLTADAFCQGDPVEYLQSLSARIALSPEQSEFIESVILLYGSMSQNKLIFLTHSEQPWAEKREGLMPFEYSERELSLDTMYQYYKARHDRNLAKQ